MASGCGGVSEEAEDGVFDIGGIVEGKTGTDARKDGVMGVFLRDFAWVENTERGSLGERKEGQDNGRVN